MSDGIRLDYYCKRCKRERHKVWHKAQWFQDYSIKCEDCGRTLWSNQTPDFERKERERRAFPSAWDRHES